MKTYYHFTADTLRDGRPVPPAGEWLKHEGELIPCKSGLHASEHPFDALQYAHGYQLHKVALNGEIIPHGNPVDKVCAEGRKILATVNAEDLCREFARRVAVDVIDKWDAPKVVREYLTTGDETLRDAALASAREAARDAVRDAALTKYRAWFLEMVEAEFAKHENKSLV